MGLFSRKQEPAPEPVRRDRVMRLLQASLEDLDADPDGDGDTARRLSAAYKECTKAEMRAAHEAARRRGC